MVEHLNVYLVTNTLFLWQNILKVKVFFSHLWKIKNASSTTAKVRLFNVCCCHWLAGIEILHKFVGASIKMCQKPFKQINHLIRRSMFQKKVQKNPKWMVMLWLIGCTIGQHLSYTIIPSLEHLVAAYLLIVHPLSSQLLSSLQITD